MPKWNKDLDPYFLFQCRIGIQVQVHTWVHVQQCKWAIIQLCVNRLPDLCLTVPSPINPWMVHCILWIQVEWCGHSNPTCHNLFELFALTGSRDAKISLLRQLAPSCLLAFKSHLVKLSQHLLCSLVWTDPKTVPVCWWGTCICHTAWCAGSGGGSRAGWGSTRCPCAPAGSPAGWLASGATPPCFRSTTNSEELAGKLFYNGCPFSLF